MCLLLYILNISEAFSGHNYSPSLENSIDFHVFSCLVNIYSLFLSHLKVNRIKQSIKVINIVFFINNRLSFREF